MEMTYRGHVKNGEIKLDQPARLPEGAQVSIQVVEHTARIPRKQQPRAFRPIQMPGGSLADELIRDRR
jgi:hypothetical protein